MNSNAWPESPVAHLDDLAVGSLKMVRVDGARICLVRTAAGVFALDHACPHEGYGLTQGSLNSDLLTCAWHNWKFQVDDGACVQGEEGVQSHDVDVDDQGAVRVRLVEPPTEEVRVRLRASLRRGIEKQYIGQVARDVVRMLRADANPGELIWEAVAHGCPRADFGWGHSIASATDCLAMIDLYDGDERALPIVQGIAGIAESERDRPIRTLPDPMRTVAEIDRQRFRSAIEAEQTGQAQAILRGAIHRGDGPEDLGPWFTAIVSDHHLSYGHGAIYSQKAFELLDMIGWDRADTVLPHLVPTIVVGTREDQLPYMRPFMRALAAADIDASASVGALPGWADDGTLLASLLGSDRVEPLTATVAALREGAGVDGILDTVVRAVSERMLRYDPAGEFDFSDDFGWLDITHGLTYAHAVRWHHRQAGETTPDLVRLACFTAFLAHWTGRHEWHAGVGRSADVEPVEAALTAYGESLQRQALMDATSTFIVTAHAVKTSRAAAIEAERIGSPMPLDAVARFLAGPRLERFVASTVHRSIDFVAGRGPDR